MVPTEVDGLYAGNRQKARILERTERGVDVDEKPFAPYSEASEYIWYPVGRATGSRVSDVAKRRSALRMAGRLGVEKTRVTKGGGIRFDSYAAFKQSLGRKGVDLRGPSAPHMLQAITVKTSGSKSLVADATRRGSSQLREVVIGVYGEAAKRGTGHNEGNAKKKLPQRRWFGASRKDAEQFAADLATSIRKRLGG